MAIKRFSGETLIGLSTDTKPLNILDGARFFEEDTLTTYLKINGVWTPISAALASKNSITGDGKNGTEFELVGDEAVVAPKKYYGTAENNALGYHELPSEAVQTLVGATPTFDLNLGRGAVITLSANTIITFSNLAANDTGHIKVTQTGGGGYKLDFAGTLIHIAANSYENVGRVKLTYTGGSNDIVVYWYDGSVVNLAVIYNVQL